MAKQDLESRRSIAAPTIQARMSADEIQIRDCGRVSERTRGFLALFFYENGFPPFNTTFYYS
jgi:hypothetical protein